MGFGFGLVVGGGFGFVVTVVGGSVVVVVEVVVVGIVLSNAADRTTVCSAWSPASALAHAAPSIINAIRTSPRLRMRRSG